MKPWLLIDCYRRPGLAASDFLPHVRPRPVRSLRVAEEPLPERCDAYEGLLITGSSASVCTSPPAWVGPLIRFTRAASRRGLPILGVCFGHQLLAEAAVGPGAVRTRSRAEVGWHELIVHADDPLLRGLPLPARVFVSHEDEVVSGLDGLQILASTAACPTQIVRVRGQPQWGVQFHTELSPEEETRLVRWRATRHPELDLDVDRMLAAAVDSAPLARALFRAFFEASARGSSLG